VNERELADAQRTLDYVGVRSKAKKVSLPSAGIGILGFLAFMALSIAVLGTAGAFLAIIISLIAIASLVKNAEPTRELRLLPEGISDLQTMRILSYADIDAVALVGNVVTVRASAHTLDLQTGDLGLAPTLHGYLEEHVRAAHAFEEERRVATEYLARIETQDYRHAGPPASALEAIARAKGMPLQLRVEAARAIELDEEELGVTEELKDSKAMFDE
jgi:hypothetical protein